MGAEPKTDAVHFPSPPLLRRQSLLLYTARQSQIYTGVKKGVSVGGAGLQEANALGTSWTLLQPQHSVGRGGVSASTCAHFQRQDPRTAGSDGEQAAKRDTPRVVLVHTSLFQKELRKLLALFLPLPARSCCPSYQSPGV